MAAASAISSLGCRSRIGGAGIEEEGDSPSTSSSAIVLKVKALSSLFRGGKKEKKSHPPQNKTGSDHAFIYHWKCELVTIKVENEERSG